MKTLVLGATGFVGSHIVEELETRCKYKIYTPPHIDCNLLDLNQINEIINTINPINIINAAALSGGIVWNQQNSHQIYHDNTMIYMNVLKAASECISVKKILTLISSCAYPNLDTNLVEDDMWNGLPDESIRYFGLAKRNAIAYSLALNKQFPRKQFLCPVINNMYGPRDSLNLNKTKVVNAMIKKISTAIEHDYQTVPILGTGKPIRQFTYIKDGVNGIINMMENYYVGNIVRPEDILLNITTQEETSITTLAETISKIMEYRGQLRYDIIQPDGQMRKSMNGDKAKRMLGFEAKWTLEEGLKETINWYKEQIND